MKYLLLLSLLGGCAELARFEDKATEEAARGITDACDSPSATASSYIDSVNKHLSTAEGRRGDQISVTCAPRP